MSVIVKNMEMPDRCDRCFFARWSNLHQTAWCTLAQEACFEDYSNDYKNRRADFCPLVEIPTPHGRLIDADEIEYEKLYIDDVGKSYEMVGKDDIDDAETVIEAEGEAK